MQKKNSPFNEQKMSDTIPLSIVFKTSKKKHSTSGDHPNVALRYKPLDLLIRSCLRE